MEIFRKFVTKTDVNRLAVPAAALNFLPGFGEGHTVHILVTDRMGRVHNIRCRIRRNGYRKPIFDAGWRHLVRQNNIRVGDRNIFLAAGDHYRIQVWRLVSLMGSLIWGQV